MKPKKISAFAEIVGAAAIVMSLVYVALEVRQNTRAQDAATFQEISRDVRALIDLIPTAIREKVRNGEQLTSVEVLEYIHFNAQAMRLYESWWHQWQLGTLSDEVFESYISHMNATLGDAVSRNTFVNTTVIRYLPGFKAYVEDYIASNPLHE